MKINWIVSEKYFGTDESVKRQITDSVSENSTDSDLESTSITEELKKQIYLISKPVSNNGSNQKGIPQVWKQNFSEPRPCILWDPGSKLHS